MRWPLAPHLSFSACPDALACLADRCQFTTLADVTPNDGAFRFIMPGTTGSGTAAMDERHRAVMLTDSARSAVGLSAFFFVAGITVRVASDATGISAGGTLALAFAPVALDGHGASGSFSITLALPSSDGKNLIETHSLRSSVPHANGDGVEVMPSSPLYRLHPRNNWRVVVRWSERREVVGFSAPFSITAAATPASGNSGNTGSGDIGNSNSKNKNNADATDSDDDTRGRSFRLEGPGADHCDCVVLGGALRLGRNYP